MWVLILILLDIVYSRFNYCQFWYWHYYFTLIKLLCYKPGAYLATYESQNFGGDTPKKASSRH